MKCPTQMFLTRVTRHKNVSVGGYRELPTVLRIFSYFTYCWVYFEERCYWSVNDSCPFLMFSYVWCGPFFRGEAFALHHIWKMDWSHACHAWWSEEKPRTLTWLVFIFSLKWRLPTVRRISPSCYLIWLQGLLEAVTIYRRTTLTAVCYCKEENVEHWAECQDKL